MGSFFVLDNYVYLRIQYICAVGDYMYPTEPDYEGTKDMFPPLLSSSIDDLTDCSRGLNRVVFTNHQTVRSLSQVDTTVQDTTAVDNLLQNGTVLCNI